VLPKSPSPSPFRLVPRVLFLAPAIGLACANPDGPDPVLGDGTSSAETTAAGTESSSSETSETDGGVLDLPYNPGWGDESCEEAEIIDSSAGCLFHPLMLESDNNVLPWAVAAGNPNDFTADVTLYAKDGAVLEATTIPPFGLHTFVLDPSDANYAKHDLELATGVTDRVLTLESTSPVVAYQFSPYSASQQATSDASLLLPVHGWGRDHLVAGAGAPGRAGIAVVAIADGTEVTISLPTSFTSTTEAGTNIPAMTGGDTHQVTLAAGEVLQLHHDLSVSGHDFTGTRIESTEDVAVFFTAPLMTIPGSNEFADHLEIQMPPRSAWGDRYAAVHFRPRGSTGTEVDVFRFVAHGDATTINISGDVTQTLMLDEGEFMDVSTPGSFWAEGNGAFMVAHLMVSTSLTPGDKDDTAYPGDFLSPNCDALDPTDGYTHVGDPALSWVVPTDQFRDRYVFATPSTYAWDMVTVIAETSRFGELQLDGAALSGTVTPVPGNADFSFVREIVDDGAHVIESTMDDPVSLGIEVYGYDCRVSYAYPGGTRLSDINPVG
jgi:hypothetical protein